MKKVKIVGTCSTLRRYNKLLQYSVENLKGREIFGDTIVHAIIILNTS